MLASDQPHGGRIAALFGTFDVENFGDLLFPLLAQHGLGAAVSDFAFFSPKGGRVPWDDTVVAQPVRAAAMVHPDLCLIGGGNIVHADSSPLPAYAPLGGDLPFAYASLWLGASIVAARTDAVLVWNAPGLPRPLGQPWARDLCDLGLQASDYVSTRDAQSRDWLDPSGLAFVVPDTALDIAGLWPADNLVSYARDAFASRHMPPPPRWLVFHLNSRYLDGDPADHAHIIDRICAKAAARPVLIAFGPCHGDDALARAVGASMQGNVLLVDRPRGLKEVAALVAHSCGYVGSSLHGMITAFSYRRPAIAVARPAMIKFRGLLDQLGMPERLAESWGAAEQAAASLLRPLPATALAAIADALHRIHAHWAAIKNLIDTPTRAAMDGRRKLREAVAAQPARWPEWTALDRLVNGQPAATEPRHCPICDGTAFKPGPGGRFSRSGLPPQCVRCGALERHRIYRGILEAMCIPAHRNQNCLMFSRDPTVAAAWFTRHEVSIFGGDNSLDLQAIARPDASYGVVVCNHVLEHVADYRAALRELIRIARPDGFVFLSFPDPMSRATTIDWGYPNPQQHDHYRIFGRDVETVFGTEIPECQVIAVTGRDPVTDVENMAYILTRAAPLLARMEAKGLAVRLVQEGRDLVTVVAPNVPADLSNEIAALVEALRATPVPDDVEERLHQALKRWPKELRLRLLHGEWLQHRGDLEAAAACLQAAMRDHPANPWPPLRMARLLLLRGDIADAQALFASTIWQSDLPDAPRRDLLRQIVDQTHDPQICRHFLETLLAQKPGDSVALRLLRSPIERMEANAGGA